MRPQLEALAARVQNLASKVPKSWSQSTGPSPPMPRGSAKTNKNSTHSSVSAPKASASPIIISISQDDSDNDEDSADIPDVLLNEVTLQRLAFLGAYFLAAGPPSDLENLIWCRVLEEAHKHMHVHFPWLVAVEAGLKFGTWRQALMSELKARRADRRERMTQPILHDILSCTAIRVSQVRGADNDWVHPRPNKTRIINAIIAFCSISFLVNKWWESVRTQSLTPLIISLSKFQTYRSTTGTEFEVTAL